MKPIWVLNWLCGCTLANTLKHYQEYLALDRAEASSDQLKLIQDLLDSYDNKAKPTWDVFRPVNVTFSMDLYQLLELNEPQQYILLNAWIIERWHDEFLYWNPLDYGNISEVRLPHHCIWLPDTTLYNSLVMKDDDTRRLLNAKLTTNTTRKAALIELLYPTIYKFSCLLNLRYFPFDLQVCTMTFSSWTYDQKGIDYLPYSSEIGTSNFIENEGWYLFKTAIKRDDVKYSCCPNNYTLLRLTLFLRRKPLFYLVNLIIPTAIITLIAIVGFFTTSSASGMREEKVSLGITTLLSMSILMLMVSDQMPTTSTFIPLIGWFILGMIIVISSGTLASSVVIAVQKKGRMGERLSSRAVKITRFFGYISISDVPLHLRKGTKEHAEAPPLNEAYKKSVKIQKKLDKVGAEEDARKKSSVVNFFRRKATNQNGLSTDKSTDPLVTAAFQSENGHSNPAASAETPLHIAFDDTISQGDSENAESKQTTARSNRMAKDRMLQHIGVFNENVRLSRQLAQKEYEWLATVMERCFFGIFVSLFLVISVGINLIGYWHWSDVESIVKERANLLEPEL
ncbi:unnamed protein product [Bursaphelenchus okinawaensis]|uniref:Uncharacterized protein n=1 Tax=Bursaphelenchus okinawaensis TaxID=465554 RepID=A0A811KCT1_9BILA|nr:unnamed protein product [Bursaphelenchus okinawaensis]CAG9098788.1 unnamed protein product [Bursaphelenchus okinawaensis]